MADPTYSQIMDHLYKLITIYWEKQSNAMQFFTDIYTNIKSGGKRDPKVIEEFDALSDKADMWREELYDYIHRLVTEGWVNKSDINRAFMAFMRKPEDRKPKWWRTVKDPMHHSKPLDLGLDESKFTAPQRALLNELDLSKLIKKAGINKQPSQEYPQRSGNLETPAKNPRHRKFLGQDPEGRGTMADKPGRESSEKSVHANKTSMEDPTGLENLGDPFDRGLSDNLVGDDASMHPSLKHKPTRLQGPGENPGAQTWTSFGNRYPGIKSL